MKSRLVGIVAMLALVATMTSGCFAQPAPAPSATALFASEDEAFAAAEATYRAYVDALNHRRDDPGSHPDPTSFLVGKALEDQIDAKRQLDEAGVSIEGPTKLSEVDRKSINQDYSLVELAVCLDSSATRVVDNDGNDITPTDRPNPVSLKIGMLQVDGRFIVEKSETLAVGECLPAQS